ncbi:MAG: RIP metalloprotease RseP [Azonexus sp.]|jgi:regulator of sigma E protease|nr:RIP metalloprotease RseP [Azonexus sp.]
MSDLFFYLAAFALLLGVLIVVHEYGHYLVARWCGVKVLRFSIGFGRVIWYKRFGRDGTEWAISAFPLGGYVKMLGEQDDEVKPEEAHRAFNRQPVGRRSLIVVAGPAANLLLAVVLYWGIFLHGSNELLPILGAPPDGTPAAVIGVVNGEQVRRVDGQTVATWDDLRWLLLQAATRQDSAELEVINEQHEIAIRRLPLTAAGEKGWQGDALARLGIVFFRPQDPAVIGRVTAGGPAARAGLLPGDQVLALDGQPITLWYELRLSIRQAVDRPVRIKFARADQTMTVEVTPEVVIESGLRVGQIGVEMAGGEAQRQIRTFVRYGFFAAGQKALTETWEKSVFSLVMLGRMLTGEVSWKNISGPVTIADYAGKTAKLGIDYYIKFMAVVSVALGVFNLLPIPVLDGGHLMYHALEVVRRKPLTERALEVSQQIGISLLFVLMAFAFFNDFNRLFSG